jgi:hypothetical protein
MEPPQRDANVRTLHGVRGTAHATCSLSRSATAAIVRSLGASTPVRSVRSASSTTAVMSTRLLDLSLPAASTDSATWARHVPWSRLGGVPRVDYFNDANTPKANSLVPSVTPAVRRPGPSPAYQERQRPVGTTGRGHGHRRDRGRRHPRDPRGDGDDRRDHRFVGIYTNPRHVMAYDDGDVRQQFSICSLARPLSGQALEDGAETKSARWVDPTPSTS